MTYALCNLHDLCPVDPNETARDMTDRYKVECSNAKIRPIAKLLEQLEVSRVSV